MATFRPVSRRTRAAIGLAAALLAGLLVACESAPDLHGSGSEHWQVFGIGLHF
ncbi:MAG TPA: hypothetical protein VMB81_10320 [Candidatus Sulfotelmatobacter sp.]|nr:hypothetical protein [Candidatus Sulfotelmatobacter sp.]